MGDQIMKLGDQIKTVKEGLKKEGKSGKQINEDPKIKVLVDELLALKAQLPAEGAAPKAAAPAPAAASGGDLDDQIKKVGDEIRELKEKLKGEGLSGEKVNEHEEVKKLVARLTELKGQK